MFRSDFRREVWVGVFIFWIVEIVDDVKMKYNANIYLLYNRFYMIICLITHLS